MKETDFFSGGCLSISSFLISVVKPKVDEYSSFDFDVAHFELFLASKNKIYIKKYII